MQILCLMGPTGVGKSALAMELASELPIDIISVDSAMVYRGMDIGTAKPSKAEQARVPHALIDICDPKYPYSAGLFVADAKEAIEATLKRNRTPLLVGGTMLYYRALQQGLADLPDASPEIRANIEREAEIIGWPALHMQLQKHDPEAAMQIKPHDAQRIQRALEVIEITGKKLSDLWQNSQTSSPFTYHNVALMPTDRERLHADIATRFRAMLKRGLLEEVEVLYRRGDLCADLPSMRAVGYRQIWAHFSGELTFEAMCERAIIATRQLAKRQLTWLKSWKSVTILQRENKGFSELKESFLSAIPRKIN